MKQILFKLSDGSLAYCRPCAPVAEGETDQAYLDRVAEKTLADNQHDPLWQGATRVADVDPDVIPTDQESWKYREAWDWVTDKPEIDIDMTKARAIKRGHLRQERAVRFQKLDIDYLRADEAGDAQTKKRLQQRKQALRDAPADPRIEKAASLTDLEAITLQSIENGERS